MKDVPALLTRHNVSATAARRFSNGEVKKDRNRNVEALEGSKLMILSASIEDRTWAMPRDNGDQTIDVLALDQDTSKILVTAMLVTKAEFNSAEFAVCTRTDAKKKGVGWSWLGHATSYAQAMGLGRIFSVQSFCQADALYLERKMGPSIKMGPGDACELLVEKICHPA
ncbi:hypothetical protein GCM10023115_20260 [Pontixanthobacter gangjinensis]|uniref:hypothetical protein n=1 Tax=Pontixanthobacter gangjinensis TaxID=1028742 RepID=UPI0013711D45|nr:hypothetical protein [Pontixanthobacter gangjinensis]